MSTRVAAHPFKDALSELQQENEKSGLLPTSMMDCLRKLGDKGQEQIANTFKERDRNLLRSFENRVEDGEDCWRKMCATAKKHRLRPPDPKAFIVALLEIKGVADAYNSRAKGLGYLQVQYWKQMDKLKKGLDQKIRDAQSLDQVRLLKDDFDAQMRDLRASVPRFKQPHKRRREVPRMGRASRRYSRGACPASSMNCAVNGLTVR
jgi:hypothetical protein